MDGGEGPGQTLFHVVRYWARRWNAFDGSTDTGRDVQVTEAVAACRHSGGATVNEVADELGIDQSGASRLIARAVDRGYLRKAVSADDARRRAVLVTDKGTELLRDAHTWQEAVFTDLTAGWPPEDVRTLHRMLARLLARRHGGGAESEPPD
ncbi:MarR family winged helix-turn-helix transcriptional regulator [Allonocardiopsis opalescens]|uniref:MarR family transcriptional regulator n=1 Tax=Allonocardiopsis opalescens TaxID=1144618 RepID=A0A2T0Q3P8_9ACTN|nr:MarR family winged helix-turn-helix transcriptional regulator [Allonocardiopsis opalescens]PRX98429.1 MarR family transcriptional regulator [Allonocardiopsis opalescens]